MPNYIYQNTIFTEQQIANAAEQQLMSVKEYLAANTDIQRQPDTTYNYKGKEFSFNKISKAADDNLLSVEDYLKDNPEITSKVFVNQDLEKDIRSVYDKSQESLKGIKWAAGGLIPGYGAEEILSKGLRKLLATSGYEIEESEIGDVIEITNPNKVKRKFKVGRGVLGY